MSERAKHNTSSRLLVEIVTHAERGEPLPRTTDLAARLGCRAQNISMAMAHLERSGVIRVLSQTANGRLKRVRVVETGAVTGEPE